MKIKFYLMNSFLIETGDKRIVIDPGGDFYFFSLFKTLIPKNEWAGVTHILVTHGDPDHHWHTDRVAQVSNAPVICNQAMVKEEAGKKLMLAPRGKGLAFTTTLEKIVPLSIDETREVDGVRVTGIKTTHGCLRINFGPFSKTLHPGPEERIGFGALGFKIEHAGKTIVNLGDTILHETEWQKIKSPDVLMLPIGGSVPQNTMDEKDALKAVEVIAPKLVIPTHYNCRVLFSRNYNPADDQTFKTEVEKMGARCVIMKKGDLLEC